MLIKLASIYMLTNTIIIHTYLMCIDFMQTFMFLLLSMSGLYNNRNVSLIAVQLYYYSVQ